MRQYLDLLRRIRNEGVPSDDRTGVGTLSLFGPQYEIDLDEGFPLLTTKKVFFRGVVVEMLWFLSGSTDAKVLKDQNVHIWDDWATAEKCAKFSREENDLGPVYGWQWRRFGAAYDDDEIEERGVDDGFDQIAWLINEIKTNPNSRRLIISGWNPKQAGRVELPPCHTLFQFSVRNGKLSCKLYMRSADMFLGVPFNVASYALLMHMIAQVCGLKVGRLIHSFGDAHIYKNHLDQVDEQLTRRTKPLPTLLVSPGVTDIFKFTASDFTIAGYDPDPAIKAPIAV